MTDEVEAMVDGYKQMAGHWQIYKVLIFFRGFI